MPSITFRCPSCQATDRADLASEVVHCRACNVVVCSPGDRFVGMSEGQTTTDAADKTSASNETLGADSSIKRCLICNGQELFIRKDFPQRLGVTIVLLGFAASCITWNYQWVKATFGILFGTALVDIALYFLMGNVLECYQCHTQFRGLPQLEGHEAFDLEIHERHRQQAARMKEIEKEQAH